MGSFLETAYLEFKGSSSMLQNFTLQTLGALSTLKLQRSVVPDTTSSLHLQFSD